MASSYSVLFSFEAGQDLNSICKYVEVSLKNPQAASKISDSITSSALSLSSFPKRYRVRKKDHRGHDIRYMPVGDFLLLYFVDDSVNAVNIIRIAYGRRNLDSLI